MLAVAKIVKSFGTDGGLLLSSNVDLETLDFKEPVFITFDGLQVPFFILDCTPKGGKTVVHLNDVHSLEDAEEIVGRTIYADVELEEDEEIDFTGWGIVDRGRRIGTCTGLEDIPGNPCLEVCLEPDGSSVLIPLHEDFIVKIDEDSRTLSLILPDGLY
jgi:ribosomal 30S subunit maturation factor RimM